MLEVDADFRQVNVLSSANAQSLERDESILRDPARLREYLYQQQDNALCQFGLDLGTSFDERNLQETTELVLHALCFLWAPCLPTQGPFQGLQDWDKQVEDDCI